MRRLAALIAAALLSAGCLQSRVVGPSGPKVKPESNFVLTVYEVVETPEEDVLSYTRVYIDGQFAGETTAGPKSSEKTWETRLDAGNHLVSFERWAVGAGGALEKLPEEMQARERFVRVETGKRTKVLIKFFDRGRRHVPRVTRESLFPESP